MEVIDFVAPQPPSGKEVTIIPLGDIHLGNVNCDKKYLQNTIKWIADHPNTYVIGMGDYCENIYGDDRRIDIDAMDREIFTPEEQYLKIKQILSPIKDKIIVLLTGNHEDTIRKRVGIDMTRRLCYDLGIPYGGICSFVRFGIDGYHSPKLKIFAHHGYDSGRRLGSKINNVEDLSRSFDADIYLLGHSHAIGAATSVRIGIGCRGKFIHKRKVIFGRTGSFLNVYDVGARNYAEDKCLPPQRIGVIRIDIYRRPSPYDSLLDIHVRE